jgi:hypothetical protein
MAGDLHATPIESEQISRLEYDASCPLSLAFDRDEAHRWTLRRFANCLNVSRGVF